MAFQGAKVFVLFLAQARAFVQYDIQLTSGSLPCYRLSAPKRFSDARLGRRENGVRAEWAGQVEEVQDDSDFGEPVGGLFGIAAIVLEINIQAASTTAWTGTR